MPKRIAVLYDRLSTVRQVEEGVMLEARADSLPAFCEAKGWKVAAFYTDAGRSGREGKKRPGFDKAMEHACQPGHVLVVDNLSRFARSTVDAANALKRLRDAKAHIVIVNLGVDTTTSCGKLVFDIFAAVAEFESNQISDRTKAARDYIYRMTGEYPGGRNRYGATPEEQEIIAKVHAAAEIIKSPWGRWKKIANYLNEQGVITIPELRAQKNGGHPSTYDLWTSEMVRYILCPERQNHYRKKKVKHAVA